MDEKASFDFTMPFNLVDDTEMREKILAALPLQDYDYLVKVGDLLKNNPLFEIDTSWEPKEGKLVSHLDEVKFVASALKIAKSHRVIDGVRSVGVYRLLGYGERAGNRDNEMVVVLDGKPLIEIIRTPCAAGYTSGRIEAREYGGEGRFVQDVHLYTKHHADKQHSLDLAVVSGGMPEFFDKLFIEARDFYRAQTFNQ